MDKKWFALICIIILLVVGLIVYTSFMNQETEVKQVTKKDNLLFYTSRRCDKQRPREDQLRHAAVTNNAQETMTQDVTVLYASA